MPCTGPRNDPVRRRRQQAQLQINTETDATQSVRVGVPDTGPGLAPEGHLEPVVHALANQRMMPAQRSGIRIEFG